MIIWILLAIVVVIGLYVMLTYNGLVALRNKIEKDPAKPRHIRTVREFGYKFEA